MKEPIIYERKDGKHACRNCGRHTTVWGVEYGYDHPERYDGISEWWCNETVGGCGIRMGRWSHKVLKKGEYEYRWGEKPKKKRARNTIPPESM